MKIDVLRWAVAAAAVVSVLGWTGVAGAQTADEPLLLEVGKWAPYIDFEATDRGSLSQKVVRAFAAAGVNVKLAEVSWKGADQHVGDGHVVSFGWVKNPDRLKRWRFSDPICRSVSALVSRRADPVAGTSVNDLKGRKIGWARGYSYGPKFDALRPELTVFEMQDDEAGLRRLLVASVDAMPMDLLVARELIKRKFTPEQAQALVVESRPDLVIASELLHVVCDLQSAQCTKTIERFNQGQLRVRGSARVPDCTAD